MMMCRPVALPLLFVAQAAAFSPAGLAGLPNRGALRTCDRASASWRCAATDTESYTILPSALKHKGGGWTIQGVKPPPKEGTVWARARPKVGEVQKMGSGSFGTIYLGTDLLTSEEVAVKTEKDIGQKYSMLKHEGTMLVELQAGPGIADVHWIGDRMLGGEKSNIMVMELLGPDMEDLLEFLGVRTFSPKTGLMIARQMIDCLEHVHSKGILHRDIKPENFLMGVKSHANKVYLIDFGLAYWYVDDEGNHVPMESTKGQEMRGTVRYASINKHKGCLESRRDDLEEMMYVIIYLMRGPLPWQSSEMMTVDGLPKKEKDRQSALDTICEMKENTPMQDFCYGNNLPENVSGMLMELLTYTRNLEYAQDPDYEWMRKKMDAVMKSNGWAVDYEYDWGNKVPEAKGASLSFHNLIRGLKMTI